MKRSNDNGNRSLDNIKKARRNPKYGSSNFFLAADCYYKAVPSLRLNHPINRSLNSYQKDAANDNSETNIIGRTIYIGNLPLDVEADKLIDLIKFGPLESVKIIPDKSCAFISFMNAALAKSFYDEVTSKQFFFEGRELKVGWGKPSTVPEDIQLAFNENNASRNIFLRNLDHSFTERILYRDLNEYGLIDNVKIFKEKNIAYVHFLSISSAIKAVKSLKTKVAYRKIKIGYAKDRCDRYVQNSLPTSSIALQGSEKTDTLKYSMETHNPYLGSMPTDNPYFNAMTSASALFHKASDPIKNQEILPAKTIAEAIHNVGNRTVYLGNIDPETKCEEICNVIRGGILQQIRYMPEKHVAFVTFIDPNNAMSFLYLALKEGVVVRNRRLKVGWGKNSGPLPRHIKRAVGTQHASRNIYIAKLGEEVTEEKLHEDFKRYGETEFINIVKEKSCGFVNFRSISSAINAMEDVLRRNDYKDYYINYGKDRCGNAPLVKL